VRRRLGLRARKPPIRGNVRDTDPSIMRTLTLSDLSLALPDLLDRKASDFDVTLAAQLYLPRLRMLRAELTALSPHVETAETFVAEISAADARHDGYAGALAGFAAAYLRLPDLPSSDRRALENLRGTVLPELEDARVPYATEANLALERSRTITEAQLQHLERFPLPEGRSLRDVFEAYVAAGRDLDTLLRRRADEAQQSVIDRRTAGQLRARAIGLLTQLREAIAMEFEDDPEQTAAIDRQVFGYIDALHDARTASGPMGTQGTQSSP